MRGGKCPTCGKKELYAFYPKPWVLKCGRPQKCGREIHVKDLYDDLFDDWSKQHETTPEAPNAAADAYLRYSRGFDPAVIAGLYTQENFWDAKIKQGSATVRFPLDKGEFWERLIDRPHRFGKQKARFKPGASYAGVWWAAPVVKERLAEIRELWIVEGIFDAIACLHHGIDAVSAMSSNAYPEESLRALAELRKGDLPTLVWALDNEPGARAYIHKHIKRAKALGFTSRAALIPQTTARKVDWNDLHLRALAESDGAAQQWAADVAEARYQGDLLLSNSAAEKGLLMYQHDGRNEFHFGFRSRLYWFHFAAVAYEKAKADLVKANNGEEVGDEELTKLKRAASSVSQIANCYPEALYFQRHEVTDESWYYFRVDFPHDAPSVKGAFTGSHVSSATEFKKRIISLAQGAVYSGSQHQMDRMMEDQLFNIKTVDLIDFIGYDKEHKAYVFGDLAVRNGEVVQANAEDYFEFDKLRLKSTQKSIRMQIERDGQSFRTDWLPWLWLCFGTRGMVALTFYFGSLFAEQIRDQFKSFPFLEATGEAGAGKTTLLEFLWKLLARRDYEGFDPSKATGPGRARAMGQVSNMPIVLLEADRSDQGKEQTKAHVKAFDWDELKDFYGGGTLATRGVRNGGNETYEPPFRGTIIISQNAPVTGSEAIRSRIVKLHFKRPQVTTESRIAADNLNGLQVEELSHFLLLAVRKEAAVLAKFAEKVGLYESILRAKPELRMERIVKNHAQMMALLDALCLVLPVPEDMVKETRAALANMALERQAAMSADHPQVAEFWEVYEYLENLSDKPVVNHSRDDKLIAINLNEFAAKAAHHNQKLADLNLLRDLLVDSRSHKLVNKNVSVNSAIRDRENSGNGSFLSTKPTTVKCWVFTK